MTVYVEKNTVLLVGINKLSRKENVGIFGWNMPYKMIC